MSLRLARVVAMHPEDHSIDLVMVDDGSRLAGIQVLTSSASSNSGVSDMPTPSTPASGDKWSLAERTDCDMIAVVGFFGLQPMVLGFLYPQVSQMLFKEPNRRMMRHASDVYSTIDGAGNTEFYHPSGAFIRIGTSPAHEDLTGKDVDGKWKISKNTGSQVHIHVEQAGGKASLDIAPDGAIVVDTLSTLTARATGAVSVTTDSTLTADVAGAATVNAPAGTTFNGPVTINGPLTWTQGMSGSGGSGAAITGDVNVTSGDVKADTISLKHHKTPTAPNGPLSEPIP